MAVYVIAEYCHVHFITPLIHQAWYFKEKNYAAIASMHTVLVIALAPKMFRYLFKFPSYCVLLSKSCLALTRMKHQAWIMVNEMQKSTGQHFLLNTKQWNKKSCNLVVVCMHGMGICKVNTICTQVRQS